MDTIKNDAPTQRKPRGRMGRVMKWLLGILVVILLLAVVTLGLRQYGLFRFPWEPEPIVVANVGGSIQEGTPGMTLEELQAVMQADADASTIHFEMNFRPVFERGSSEGTLWFVNPADNHYDMRVEIHLNSRDQLVYDSGLMPRNSHIDNDKLSVALPRGTHEATAYMLAYEPGDPDTIVNRATADVVIVVKN